MAGEELALAHHGSLAREKRAAIEERLKRGELRAIVATSSLELGIDMGAVDLVVQIESPPSVASGLQRVGRACHGVGGVPQRRAPAQAPARSRSPAPRRPRRMRAGDVEETFYPRNPLDVLAQQIVAMVSVEPIAVGRALRARAPRRALRRSAARGVRGRARHAERPLPLRRLRRAPPAHHVGPHRAAASRRAPEAIASRSPTAGTIPDRGLYGVFTAPGADGEPGAARGRARRGDGLRAARGRGLPARRVVVARGADHARPRPRHARRGRAGEDALLARRPAGTRARVRRAHRRARPRRVAKGGSRRRRACARRTRSTRPRRRGPRRATSAQQVRGDRRGAERPGHRRRALRRRRRRLARRRPVPASARACSRPGPSRSRRASARSTSRSTCTTPTTGWRSASRRATSRRRRSCSSRRPTRSRAWSRARSTARRSSRRASASAPRARSSSRAAIRGGARRSGPSASARGDLLAVASRHPTFPIVLETYRECLRDVFDLPGLVGRPARRRGAAHPRDDRRHARALALRRERPLRVRRELHLRRRRAAGRAARPGAHDRPRAAARAPRRGRAAPAPRRRGDRGARARRSSA